MSVNLSIWSTSGALPNSPCVHIQKWHLLILVEAVVNSYSRRICSMNCMQYECAAPMLLIARIRCVVCSVAFVGISWSEYHQLCVADAVVKNHWQHNHSAKCACKLMILYLSALHPMCDLLCSLRWYQLVGVIPVIWHMLL